MDVIGALVCECFWQESVAVLLGNMSDYPQWTGEWVRLKAAPSAKIIRALLLDPAIGERMHRCVQVLCDVGE